MDLEKLFTEISLQYTQDQNLIKTLWQEIKLQYTQKGRYYHNLAHLNNMLIELESVKGHITEYRVIIFSVFYHDIVYNISSKLNEEKSAEIAKKRLQKLNVDERSIDQVFKQILATNSHRESDNPDANYLIDADLSILGKDLSAYLDYTLKIRKEYSVYPDSVYKPGRKKVLRHFLEQETIFKTEYFINLYEHQARSNINYELYNLII